MLTLRTDEGSSYIQLGEVEIGSPGIGDPKRIILENTSDQRIRRITVGLSGDGAAVVQLARDEGGKPGVWADNGNEVMAMNGSLQPGEECSFWARSVYTLDDYEGERDFDFVVNTVSG